ncbi:MAG: ergothioneine biosynthesis protein EgtB, partial [Gaiellaceae bacterium]
KLLSADTAGDRYSRTSLSVSSYEAQTASRQHREISKNDLAAALATAREQTRRLLEPLSAADLSAQHSELMSPLVWDLAHIGWYEEYWLLRELGADTTDRSEFDTIYDAFGNPRSDRPNLPLLDPTAAWTYCDEVRARVLEHLGQVDLDSGERLLASGFVYGLVAQHELQHNETMLQTLQLRSDPYPLPDLSAPPVASSGSQPAGEVAFEGGEVTVGSDHAWAYDNEQPQGSVWQPPFSIDRMPVTNAEYQAFMDDGGYGAEEFWAPAGWSYLSSSAIQAPLGWSRNGDGSWVRRRLGNPETIPAEEPVQHVSWFEADAYARWAGKRLPTESEWETATAWDPDNGRSRVYPWGDAYEPGRANLGLATLGPSAIGSFGSGVTPLGCEHTVGDVWEWTSSDFVAYDGFNAFPYPEYSEVFFGAEYKVLRGGSWATAPSVARASFRNWDFPIRRQLFVGFRCARDA